MTGPEHYREAERLAAQAANEWPKSAENEPYPRAAFLTAQAQVHAMLAQAAAFLELSE